MTPYNEDDFFIDDQGVEYVRGTIVPVSLESLMRVKKTVALYNNEIADLQEQLVTLNAAHKRLREFIAIGGEVIG